MSNSIGAYELARYAAKMETSINVGKREQLKQNLRGFIDELVYLLLILEDYGRFVDEVSGMTDEEYAAKMTKQSDKSVEDSSEEKSVPEDLTIIPIALLEEIVAKAESNDFESAKKQLERIMQYGYDGDNLEFLQALSEVVVAENVDAVKELVNTYKDLKL